MTVELEEYIEAPIGAGVIQLDFELLGRVLTDYAHSIEHIPEKQFIEVEDVEYNTDHKILTAHINVIQMTEH